MKKREVDYCCINCQSAAENACHLALEKRPDSDFFSQNSDGNYKQKKVGECC